MKGGELIREARLRAELTQVELARRLKTGQPVIARWESGSRSPRFETVVKAIRACGLDLSVGIYNFDHDHGYLIEDQLRISPERRLDSMVKHRNNMAAWVKTAKRID